MTCKIEHEKPHLTTEYTCAVCGSTICDAHSVDHGGSIVCFDCMENNEWW
jgi:formylmethanofuran dehydrogenase subunit E